MYKGTKLYRKMNETYLNWRTVLNAFEDGLLGVGRIIYDPKPPVVSDPIVS